MIVELDVLPGVFAVCRLDPAAELPLAPAEPGGFWSLTCTADEVSVICSEAAIPEGAVVQRGWRGLRVH
jgi:hypothetical protein